MIAQSMDNDHMYSLLHEQKYFLSYAFKQINKLSNYNDHLSLRSLHALLRFLGNLISDNDN